MRRGTRSVDPHDQLVAPAAELVKLEPDAAVVAYLDDLAPARESAGQPITVEDAMIAATARSYGVACIVTRNTKAFVGCGVERIDPWSVN